MEVDDIVAYTATILSIDFPEVEKPTHISKLYQELCRKNRMIAEEEGIGIESRPTPYVPYALLDAVGVSTKRELYRIVFADVENTLSYVDLLHPTSTRPSPMPPNY